MKAIDRATKKWKVDLIVMSFGFGQPVEQVRKAMAEASKSAKPPLFFVATRNDGANEDVAWPARGTTGGVFGISSTDGDGCGSSFNPRDYHSSDIFYALGEEAPVDRDNPETDYVSGTTYATPIAVDIVANILGCARMAVKLSQLKSCEEYKGSLSDLFQSGWNEGGSETFNEFKA